MNNQVASAARPGTQRWQRLALGAAAAAVCLISGCGSAKLPPSGIANRIFVSNSYAGEAALSGTIDIVNAETNSLSATTISGGTNPGLMAVSPDKTLTLVYDSSTNAVTILDNATETEATTTGAGTAQLNGYTESMIDVNDNIGVAALPTAPAISPQVQNGEVDIFAVSSSGATALVGVPRAHYLALNNEGTELLVFSDNYYIAGTSSGACGGSSSGNALTVINLATIVATPVCGFDHPIGGVFSSDDSTAYIMNCGPECGGTTASVQPLSISLAETGNTNPVQVPSGTQIALPNITVNGTTMPAGASFGILNGASLYVAGTSSATPGFGTLSIVNVGANPPVANPTAYSISDGFHNRMALGPNNTLFIGSTSCIHTGCLTIFNTQSQSVGLVDTPNGDVTGIAPLAGSNIVYVVENAQLHLYDTTTNAVSTKYSVTISGQLVDVKAVDKPF